MKVNKVRVDGQMFILDPSQDVQVLQDRIIEAVQQGAGFVRFETIGRATITVLVTPAVAVRFEVIDRTEEQVNEWEARPPGIEPDDSQFEDLLGVWDF